MLAPSRIREESHPTVIGRCHCEMPRMTKTPNEQIARRGCAGLDAAIMSESGIHPSRGWNGQADGVPVGTRREMLQAVVGLAAATVLPGCASMREGSSGSRNGR